MDRDPTGGQGPTLPPIISGGLEPPPHSGMEPHQSTPVRPSQRRAPNQALPPAPSSLPPIDVAGPRARSHSPASSVSASASSPAQPPNSRQPTADPGSSTTTSARAGELPAATASGHTPPPLGSDRATATAPTYQAVIPRGVAPASLPSGATKPQPLSLAAVSSSTTTAGGGVATTHLAELRGGLPAGFPSRLAPPPGFGMQKEVLPTVMSTSGHYRASSVTSSITPSTVGVASPQSGAGPMADLIGELMAQNAALDVRLGGPGLGMPGDLPGSPPPPKLCEMCIAAETDSGDSPPASHGQQPRVAAYRCEDCARQGLPSVLCEECHIDEHRSRRTRNHRWHVLAAHPPPVTTTTSDGVATSVSVTTNASNLTTPVLRPTIAALRGLPLGASTSTQVSNAPSTVPGGAALGVPFRSPPSTTSVRTEAPLPPQRVDARAVLSLQQHMLHVLLHATPTPSSASSSTQTDTYTSAHAAALVPLLGQLEATEGAARALHYANARDGIALAAIALVSDRAARPVGPLDVRPPASLAISRDASLAATPTTSPSPQAGPAVPTGRPPLSPVRRLPGDGRGGTGSRRNSISPPPRMAPQRRIPSPPAFDGAHHQPPPSAPSNPEEADPEDVISAGQRVQLVHGEKHLPGQRHMLLVRYADGEEGWAVLEEVQHQRAVRTYMRRKMTPDVGSRSQHHEAPTGGHRRDVLGASPVGAFDLVDNDDDDDVRYESQLTNTERQELARQLAALQRINTGHTMSRGSHGVDDGDIPPAPANPPDAHLTRDEEDYEEARAYAAAETTPRGRLRVVDAYGSEEVSPASSTGRTAGLPPREPRSSLRSPNRAGSSKGSVTFGDSTGVRPTTSAPGSGRGNNTPRLPPTAVAADDDRRRLPIGLPQRLPPHRDNNDDKHYQHPTVPQPRQDGGAPRTPERQHYHHRPGSLPSDYTPEGRSDTRGPSPAVAKQQTPTPPPSVPPILPPTNEAEGGDELQRDRDVVKRYEDRVKAIEERQRHVRALREEQEERLQQLRAKQRAKDEGDRQEIHDEYEAHQRTLARDQPELQHPLYLTNERHSALLLHKLNAEIAQAERERAARDEYREERAVRRAARRRAAANRSEDEVDTSGKGGSVEDVRPPPEEEIEENHASADA